MLSGLDAFALLPDDRDEIFHSGTGRLVTGQIGFTISNLICGPQEPYVITAWRTQAKDRHKSSFKDARN